MFLRVPVVHQLVSSRLSISPPPQPFHSWTKWGGELKDAATQLLQRLISTASYYSGLETLARSLARPPSRVARLHSEPRLHPIMRIYCSAARPPSRRSALNVRRLVDDDDAHVKLHLGSFSGGRMGGWRVRVMLKNIGCLLEVGWKKKQMKGKWRRQRLESITNENICVQSQALIFRFHKTWASCFQYKSVRQNPEPPHPQHFLWMHFSLYEAA